MEAIPLELMSRSMCERKPAGSSLNELSKKMAMKIGDEYLLDKVAPRQFEKLAEETGLAKPLVKRRVPALAGMIVEAVLTIDLSQAHTEKVAAIIKQRCERTISEF